MARVLVDLGTLTGRLADRRRILEASLDHSYAAADAGQLSDADQLEREAQRHALDELDVVASILGELAQVADVTDTDRPGVLLVGAGTSRRTVVEADREDLNLDLLSDRDVALYAGLLSWVTGRLLDEQDNRRVLRSPASLLASFDTTQEHHQ